MWLLGETSPLRGPGACCPKNFKNSSKWSGREKHYHDSDVSGRNCLCGQWWISFLQRCPGAEVRKMLEAIKNINSHWSYMFIDKWDMLHKQMTIYCWLVCSKMPYICDVSVELVCRQKGYASKRVRIWHWMYAAMSICAAVLPSICIVIIFCCADLPVTQVTTRQYLDYVKSRFVLLVLSDAVCIFNLFTTGS